MDAVLLEGTLYAETMSLQLVPNAHAQVQKFLPILPMSALAARQPNRQQGRPGPPQNGDEV